MINLNVTKTITTRRQIRLEIHRAHIIQMVKELGYGLIPKDARIFVDVPGGGDWSNMELNIDDDRPVVVTWSEVTMEEQGN